MTMTLRSAAVAGTWYPASSGALAREVDGYVDRASDGPRGAIIRIEPTFVSGRRIVHVPAGDIPRSAE